MNRSAITQGLFHNIIENCVHTTALGLHKIYCCKYPLSFYYHSTVNCWCPLSEKHSLKYHLAHQAYLQVKMAEMTLVSPPGHKGHKKSIQTTLNLTSSSTHLGFNNPTKQYRTFMPFSGMNDPNSYNNSVISNISISAIYDLHAQNSWLHESTWVMQSILGRCLTHKSCPWLMHCICIPGNILSINHTMWTAAKAIIINKSGQCIKPFSAVFQVLDEESRILTWVWLSFGSYNKTNLQYTFSNSASPGASKRSRKCWLAWDLATLWLERRAHPWSFWTTAVLSNM